MPDEDLNDILEPNATDESSQPEPVEEAPEVTAEAAEAPKVVADQPAPEPTMVPLAAMTEERLKRQLLEQQLQQLQRAPEPQPLPDVLENPDGFAQSIQQQVAAATSNAQLNISEAMARQQHGASVVDAAFAAAQEAGVAESFANKQHPWGEVVTWHQQQKALAEIGDPATYRDRVKAEALREIQASMAAQQISAPSLAGETSVGGRNPAPAPTLTSLDDILS